MPPTELTSGDSVLVRPMRRNRPASGPQEQLPGAGHVPASNGQRVRRDYLASRERIDRQGQGVRSDTRHRNAAAGIGVHFARCATRTVEEFGAETKWDAEPTQAPAASQPSNGFVACPPRSPCEPRDKVTR